MQRRTVFAAATIYIVISVILSFCEAYSENRPFAELNKRYCREWNLDIHIKIDPIHKLYSVNDNTILHTRTAQTMRII